MIIDVSKYQPTIDWETVKPQIEGAILRLAYGTRQDVTFEQKARECERLGIPYGAYVFTTATSIPQAAVEADMAVKMLAGFHPTGHVWFDTETNQTKQISREATDIFCRTMQAAGLKGGVYTGQSTYKNYLMGLGVPTWIARYGVNNGSPSYKPDISPDVINLWQYTSKGRVNGITGNVDLSQIVTPFTDAAPTPATPAKVTLTVDGQWGKSTTKALQKYFGTPADGIVSGQPLSLKKYRPATSDTSWKIGTGGSMVIRALQNWLRVSSDGKMGKGTITALQRRLNVTADGICGPNTVKALQKYLNTV